MTSEEEQKELEEGMEVFGGIASKPDSLGVGQAIGAALQQCPEVKHQEILSQVEKAADLCIDASGVLNSLLYQGVDLHDVFRDEVKQLKVKAENLADEIQDLLTKIAG